MAGIAMPTRYAMKKLCIVICALSLSGCASTTQNKVEHIANTPLEDLNVNGTVIPPILLQAKDKPYAAPAEVSCLGLRVELARLDEVLGPDLDARDPNAGEGAADVVESAALGVVQHMVDGVIPFRTWLRKLSGAERHSREVAAAILAGTVRRGYLKGMAQATDCVVTPPVVTPAVTTAAKPA